MKTLYYNALIVNEGKQFPGYLLTDGDTITAVGKGDYPEQLAADITPVDCQGDLLMPGVIDTHVHFRDPGLTQKGDISTESAAAVAGGVTSFLDMPNTSPATVTLQAWEDKMRHAAEVSHANYGFYIGATNSNLDLLLKLDYSRIPAIKLFLGSSTGNMLVDDPDTLRRLFTETDALIAVHAEDEGIIRANREKLVSEYPDGKVPLYLHSTMRSPQACLKAASRAVEAAREAGARLHLMHVSTRDELNLLDPGPVDEKLITAETCPHYLLFTNDDIKSRGSRVKCNPALKNESDCEALREALRHGLIDTIATDHAPHSLSDKEGDLLKAASGMPGVQFSLPLMLSGIVSPTRAAELMSHNPATLYRINGRGFLRPGYKADIVRVRHLDEPHVITDSDVLSKCGWTPYAGLSLDYKIVTTIVNGQPAFLDGKVTDIIAAQPLTFGRPKC